MQSMKALDQPDALSKISVIGLFENFMEEIRNPFQLLMMLISLKLACLQRFLVYWMSQIIYSFMFN
mgnify:CR=1 FL=1